MDCTASAPGLPRALIRPAFPAKTTVESAATLEKPDQMTETVTKLRAGGQTAGVAGAARGGLGAA